MYSIETSVVFVLVHMRLDDHSKESNNSRLDSLGELLKQMSELLRLFFSLISILVVGNGLCYGRKSGSTIS
jgi:hypothetical protein